MDKDDRAPAWARGRPKTTQQRARLLKSNVGTVAVWRMCRHQVVGGLAAAVPQHLPGLEIECAARACETPMTARLLAHVRHVDDAYINERIRQINKQ